MDDDLPVNNRNLVLTVFKTKQRAADYYDQYNPHMRPLNAHHTWRSDWDPTTDLRYIVREYYSEHLSIAPFNPNDEPVVTVSKNSRSETYPTL